LRLAVSEADFYRKQRLALEEAAAAIAQMEREARAVEVEERTRIELPSERSL